MERLFDGLLLGDHAGLDLRRGIAHAKLAEDFEGKFQRGARPAGGNDFAIYLNAFSRVVCRIDLLFKRRIARVFAAVQQACRVQNDWRGADGGGVVAGVEDGGDQFRDDGIVAKIGRSRQSARADGQNQIRRIQIFGENIRRDGNIMGTNDLQRFGAASGGGDDIQTCAAEDVNGRQCFDFFESVGQKNGDLLAHAVDSPLRQFQNCSNIFFMETTDHTDYTDFFADSLAAEADKKYKILITNEI